MKRVIKPRIEESSIREAAIRQLLNGIGNLFSFEEVSRGLEEYGWTVHPVSFRGIVVGAIIEKDGSIHTSINPEYQRRWNPRPYIKTILYPALLKYGVLYSDAAKHDARAIRWLCKLGFQVVGEDIDRIYYQLLLNDSNNSTKNFSLAYIKAQQDAQADAAR